MVVNLYKSIEQLQSRISDFLKWAEMEDVLDSEECARIKEQINRDKWDVFKDRFGLSSESIDKHWVSDTQVVTYRKCRVCMVPLIDPEMTAVYWKNVGEAEGHL